MRIFDPENGIPSLKEVPLVEMELLIAMGA